MSLGAFWHAKIGLEICVCVCVLGILSRAPLPRRSIYGGVAPPALPRNYTPAKDTNRVHCLEGKRKPTNKRSCLLCSVVACVVGTLIWRVYYRQDPVNVLAVHKQTHRNAVVGMLLIYAIARCDLLLARLDQLHGNDSSGGRQTEILTRHSEQTFANPSWNSRNISVQRNRDESWI